MRALKHWYVVLLLLAGCAQLGLTPATSFDQQLAYTQNGITTARVAATNALNAKQISVADAQKALDLTDTATTAVAAARTAQAGGDITTAQQKLAAATAILTQLQQYLISKGVKQ